MAAKFGRSDRRKKQIEAFCRNKLAGMSQIQAWRECGVKWRHLSEQYQHDLAGVFARTPECESRYRQLLKQAELHELDSAGEAVQDLLNDMSSARQRENDTALAAYTRQRLSMHGLLNDGTRVNVGIQISDGQIAKLIAGSDTDLLAKLSGLLGAASFDDEPIPTLPKPNPE